jgi:ElaB/YqjD/DUF883 family membrane-anchored ribosome-binding protein
MSGPAGIEQAKREAVRAKERFERTLAEVQQRLSPGNLAGEAWDGVKDRSADLAEGALQAVRSRPKAVSLAIGALAVFLARQPLKRAVSRLISGDGEGNEDEGAELSVTQGAS